MVPPRYCQGTSFAKRGKLPTVEPQALCKEVSPMVYDVSPGDVIHIGDAVTLTVMAVEGNLIRFGLASPDGERPDAAPDGQQADSTQGRWENN
jgi:hypothetical protein